MEADGRPRLAAAGGQETADRGVHGQSRPGSRCDRDCDSPQRAATSDATVHVRTQEAIQALAACLYPKERAATSDASLEVLQRRAATSDGEPVTTDLVNSVPYLSSRTTSDASSGPRRRSGGRVRGRVAGAHPRHAHAESILVHPSLVHPSLNHPSPIFAARRQVAWMAAAAGHRRPTAGPRRGATALGRVTALGRAVGGRMRSGPTARAALCEQSESIRVSSIRVSSIRVSSIRVR